jgi:hypothetical protein
MVVRRSGVRLASARNVVSQSAEIDADYGTQIIDDNPVGAGCYVPPSWSRMRIRPMERQSRADAATCVGEQRATGLLERCSARTSRYGVLASP